MPTASTKNTKAKPRLNQPRTTHRFFGGGFFFEGAPAATGIRPSAGDTAEAPSPVYVADFLATSDGLSLVKAFMCIKDANLRPRSSGSSRRSRQRPREAAPHAIIRARCCGKITERGHGSERVD